MIAGKYATSIIVTLVVLFSGFLQAGALPSQSMAVRNSTVAGISGRDLEPVIVRGANVVGLIGVPVSGLFVYRYGGGTWQQIPAQIDEKAPDGRYVSSEDGLLDGNDEVVFMVRDLGDQAPADQRITDVVPQVTKWFEIEVSDPLRPGQKGWAYLVYGAGIHATFGAGYVGFDPGLHRLLGSNYVLGIGVTHPGPDYLKLGGSNVDILDRTKVAIDCTIPLICPMNDSRLPPVPDDLVRAGPVRVVLRAGRIMAYDAMVRWSTDYNTMESPIRLSIDFAPAALGSTLFGASIPSGVIVDGIADTVPTTPASAWWQLRSPTGTLIQVANTAAISGTQSNYYVDDISYDSADSGDHVHFGDAGVLIQNPPAALTYDFAFYFLSPAAPNVGATYEANFNVPVSVTATPRGGASSQHNVFLPLVERYFHVDGYDDFYAPPPLGQLTPDRLGDILRFEHIRSFTPAEVASLAAVPTTPYGAEAYRILYLSQDPVGTPRAVSALLAVPVGDAPADGYPLIVHGHMLPDLADKCAPSKNIVAVAGLLPWISQGYMVVATDYLGLGTAGVHPTLVGSAEARSMLDAARAALRFHDDARGMTSPPAANSIILDGPSLGGHAALFAQQEWPTYAPALGIRGTVVYSPIADLKSLVYQAAFPPAPTLGPVVLGLYAYSLYYGQSPVLESWLKPAYAAELPDRADTQCVASFVSWLGTNPDAALQPDWLSVVREQRWDDLQPWQQYIEPNTPGGFASQAPVLILHGLNDGINPVSSSQALAQGLCAAGTRTQLNTYVNATHFTITTIARTDVMGWVADRLAGMVPASCAIQ